MIYIYMIYYQCFQHIFQHTAVGLNKLWIFFLQLILIWISKYSCPALALGAIGGKNKACSGGNGGITLQNKVWQRVGSCGCKCDDWFLTTHKLYVHITKVGIWTNTPIQVICAFMYLVAPVNVIVEKAVRTAKVRRSSHRKSTSL